MKLLRRPHPFIYNKASFLVPGIITFILIAIIAPFGFHELSLGVRFLFALIIATVCSFSVVFIVELLKNGFPSYMNEKHWTTGKELVLFLIVTSGICLNIFLFLIGFGLTSTPPFKLFLSVVVNTLSIGIFPIIILVLYEQYNYQKKQLLKATEMNVLLSHDKEKSIDLIQLTGENGKMELQLIPEELIYLKSDGNYVEVIYGIGQLEKKLLRNRLKSLEEQLPDDLFFQCHKSFIINKRSIVSVKGNARSFEVKLRGVSEPIPVSRAKSEELNQLLKE